MAAEEILSNYPEECPETREEFLNIIRVESNRLLGLMGKLLDLAKLEAKALRLDYQKVDIAALAAHTAESILSQRPNRPTQIEIVNLREHPVLRAFVESYRGTLAGDLETLSRHFELELGGHMDAWQLRLTPRNLELAEYLSAVVLRGREGTVTSVETLEANGDRSVMTLESSGE